MNKEFFQLYGWLGIEFKCALFRFLDVYFETLTAEERIAFLEALRNYPLAAIDRLLDAVLVGAFRGKVERLGKEAVKALLKVRKARTERTAEALSILDRMVCDVVADWLLKAKAQAELGTR